MHIMAKPKVIYVLREDGPPVRFSPEEVDGFMTHYDDTGWEPKLEALHRRCECTCIDMRVLPGLGHLWFDDEGLLKDRPMNPLATAFYSFIYGMEPLVGTAVLVVDPDAMTEDEAVGLVDRAFRLVDKKRREMRSHLN